MSKTSSEKAVALALIIAILGVGVSLFTYIKVASGITGFTGPSGDPPGATGILSYDGSELDVSSQLNTNNHLITGLPNPVANSDVANKAYVDAQAGGGGGSVVFYYKELDGVPISTKPACADYNMTEVYNGYGPHYLGLAPVDWYYQGSGGYGGGFGGSTGPVDIINDGTYDPPTPPPPPPAFGSGEGSALSSGYTFVTRSVAFTSDSVCSTSQGSVLPIWNFYLNATTSQQATFQSDACSVRPGGQVECNRCIVCSQ